jgi:hypothetical protein
MKAAQRLTQERELHNASNSSEVALTSRKTVGAHTPPTLGGPQNNTDQGMKVCAPKITMLHKIINSGKNAVSSIYLHRGGCFQGPGHNAANDAAIRSSEANAQAAEPLPPAIGGQEAPR